VFRGRLEGSAWQSLTRGIGNVWTDYVREIVRIALWHAGQTRINATMAALVRQGLPRAPAREMTLEQHCRVLSRWLSS
jgi:hypothetical protein